MKNYEGFVNEQLDGDLTKDFPFIYNFDYAIVYSKSKIEEWEFRDNTEDIEDDEYESSSLSKGCRIGIVNYREDDIGVLIVITSDTVFYSNDGCMTNDGVSYFEIGKNSHYCPAQEPVDLLSNDFENGGGTEIEEAKKLKLISKKYELNWFLISV